ncbi:MAG: DUF1349 domain-containing protein [Spirochaetales bacterium]|nr:DUF1349 domain-containing protein [Spirochaetales bacterium]
MDFSNADWIFEPEKYEITSESVKITTMPGTDFWQRTYYGFRNDNAPSLLLESCENFTFTAKMDFVYGSMFDQCGLVIYEDHDNWFKVSVESETPEISRLGSVVTNNGYSDWASIDIEPVNSIWFRLSRRGPDFLIESSEDGRQFSQMRVFHMHFLGETTETMGKSEPPVPNSLSVKFGLYACSPLETSFEAVFTELKIENCIWKMHLA